jgi:hypothetical protein
MLRPIAKFSNNSGPRAGHPSLSTQRTNFVVKRRSAGSVQMRSHLVQKQDRRQAGLFSQRAAVGKDERN